MFSVNSVLSPSVFSVFESLSLGPDQPWELGAVVVEAGEHGFQISDLNVLREDFAEHGTKIRG